MKRFARLASLAILTSAAFAQQNTPKPADDLPDSPSTAAQIYREPETNGPTAVIDTSMGRLTCQFFQKETPVATANFIELAQGKKDWTDPNTLEKHHNEPFFNGVTFHRVIPGFMIQGGDRMGNGAGDPGYFFQDEIVNGLTFNQPGRLAMANAGSGPTGGGTNGSQFFITENPVPQLNGKHTIFGQCDAHSVVVVQTIARVPTNAEDKPLTPVTINKVTIVPQGQPLPADPMPPAPASPTATPSLTAPPPATPSTAPSHQ